MDTSIGLATPTGKIIDSLEGRIYTHLILIVILVLYCRSASTLIRFSSFLAYPIISAFSNYVGSTGKADLLPGGGNWYNRVGTIKVLSYVY